MKEKYRLYWMIVYSPEIHIYKNLGVAAYKLTELIYEPGVPEWYRPVVNTVSYSNRYEGYDNWGSI